MCICIFDAAIPGHHCCHYFCRPGIPPGGCPTTQLPLGRPMCPPAAAAAAAAAACNAIGAERETARKWSDVEVRVLERGRPCVEVELLVPRIESRAASIGAEHCIGYATVAADGAVRYVVSHHWSPAGFRAYGRAMIAAGLLLPAAGTGK